MRCAGAIPYRPGFINQTQPDPESDPPAFIHSFCRSPAVVRLTPRKMALEAVLDVDYQHVLTWWLAGVVGIYGIFVLVLVVYLSGWFWGLLRRWLPCLRATDSDDRPPSKAPVAGELLMSLPAFQTRRFTMDISFVGLGLALNTNGKMYDSHIISRITSHIASPSSVQ